MSMVKEIKAASAQDITKPLADGHLRALEEIGARAVDLIRQNLNTGPRSGVTLTKDGAIHKASAPGEPPTTWSGSLAQSLDYQVSAGDRVLTVSAAEPYGAYLEFGTLQISPRPFIGPVMDALAPEIEEIVQRAFNDDGPAAKQKDPAK